MRRKLKKSLSLLTVVALLFTLVISAAAAGEGGGPNAGTATGPLNGGGPNAGTATGPLNGGGPNGGGANGGGAEEESGYAYTAPTEPMAVDPNIVTGTVHRAASPAMSIMGVNITSGFGVVGTPTSLSSAQRQTALGIWGSEVNSNPDPYLWNYFYNFYAQENGLKTTADAFLNANSSASPSGADTTLLEEYGNISASLSTRPDIALGVSAQGINTGTEATGYDGQIATIQSFTPDSPYYHEGDETYSPKLVPYELNTIKDMLQTMYNLADAINEVTEETGKTTRYGDPQVIASDLEKYVYGTVAYVQEELAAKGLEEKTVAVVTYVNEDGTYTVADSLQTADLQSGTGRLERMEEYVMCVSTSLTDRYHTEMEQTETDLISGLQTTSTVKVVTLDELMQADAIVAFGRSTLRQDLLDSFGDRAYDGIIITSEPDCIYGINMQAVENAMGYAYIIASIYCDELDIDPVEMCAYFYEKFLHITDRESLEQVVRTNFSETILPQGVVPTLASDYSAAKVEAKLTRGMNYYLAHEADFQNEEYAYVGIDTWTPDLSSGIGSTSAYYSDAVEWAVENGITTGTGDGTTFSPDLACTRAQAVTFLWRAAGCPAPRSANNPFTDVSAGTYYYDAVLWAVENGITVGTSATTFSPDRICTRAQIVTFLWRAAGSTVETASNLFTDVSADTYYYDAVLWAVKHEVTDGTSTTTFSPDQNCTRAQIVTFLYRAYA